MEGWRLSRCRLEDSRQKQRANSTGLYLVSAKADGNTNMILALVMVVADVK